jgi:hypothetical protein
MADLTASWHEQPPAPLPGTPFSHFQSEHWVRLLRSYGQRPLCVWVGEGDGPPLASWLFYATPGDYLNPPKRRVTRWLDLNVRGVHGPAIDARLEGAERERVLAALLDAVAAQMRRLRPLSFSAALDPVLPADDRELWARLAAAAGFGTEPAYTYIAHLPADEEALASAVKRERRKETRKAEKLGVEFEEAHGIEALREYYDVRDETRRRNGHPPVPWSHFEQTFGALDGTPIYRIFLARREGRIGAGQLAFAWNGYWYLSGVSIATWALEEKVPANDFLQWHMLRAAVEAGQRMVDFSGAQPNSDDPKMKAIDFFKSRWGTELEESLTLTLPFSRARARASGLAQRLLG